MLSLVRNTMSGDAHAWLREVDGGVTLDVLVVPRSSRARVVAVHDKRLKIQLTSPPVDGQANDALVRFIADTLQITRAQVDIISGLTGRRKTVRVLSVPVQRVLLKLHP